MRIHWPVAFPALKYEPLLLIASIIWGSAFAEAIVHFQKN